MAEKIRLLPDHLANQIAAGEVIQRPASAVKELLENALDAQASSIQLIVKDAGKELIQVIDNGVGMSPLDARMCFERHATSKIRNIDDLFALQTMGFRGEALASIAAVAQVELKTRQADDDLGTYIHSADGEIKEQTATACAVGTSIAVKNLFYNVPARRKFLKSNTTEYKQILDEFNRVALPNPHIEFKLFHNNTEQLHLPVSNLKVRIIDLLGNRSATNLIPVDEQTDIVHIHGFIGKPEAATKTRGNQFFFVNNRFIKSHYLNHAVTSAFEGMIEKESFPFYVLFIDLDPSKIDINVHPSKQEIKFDDERLVYAFLQSAIKHALSKFNIAPSIDFTLNPDIQNLDAVRLPASTIDTQQVQSSYLSNVFKSAGKAHYIESSKEKQDWMVQKENLFQPLSNQQPPFPQMPLSNALHNNENIIPDPELWHKDFHQQPILFWKGYLISTMKSGLLILHLKRALERIQYERLQIRYTSEKIVSQQLLFPADLSIMPTDVELFDELLPTLLQIGFDIVKDGNGYQITGTPQDFSITDYQEFMEEILESFKSNTLDQNTPAIQHQQNVLKSIAKRVLVPPNIHKEYMQSVIDDLFATTQPQLTPDGLKVFTILPEDKLIGML